MHKDIEMTKMDNAYAELQPKIQQLMIDYVDKHGTVYASYAISELAVEFAARHILAMKAISEDFDKHLHTFIQDSIDRGADILEEAVKNQGTK